MADVKSLDKVKVVIAQNGLAIVGILVAIIVYLVYKMKKRNVKIIGR
jgi:hypothetical protein